MCFYINSANEIIEIYDTQTKLIPLIHQHLVFNKAAIEINIHRQIRNK